MIRVLGGTQWSDTPARDDCGIHHIADLLPLVLARYLPNDSPRNIWAEQGPRGQASIAVLDHPGVIGLCPEAVNSYKEVYDVGSVQEGIGRAGHQRRDSHSCFTDPGRHDSAGNRGSEGHIDPSRSWCGEASRLPCVPTPIAEDLVPSISRDRESGSKGRGGIRMPPHPTPLSVLCQRCLVKSRCLLSTRSLVDLPEWPAGPRREE